MPRRLRFLLPAALALGARAEPLRPATDNAMVAGLVAYTLESWHYDRKPIDDAVSREWFDIWVGALDPNRMYLLQGDVDALSSWAARLDDAVHAQPPDVSCAFEGDAVLRRRAAERIGAVLAMLDGPLELEADETVDLDREDAPWAKDTAELDGLWEKRLRSELVGLMLGDRTREEAVGILRKRYVRLRNELDQQEAADVMEVWLGALGAAYDPHTEWMKPVSKDDFDISMRDKVEGIGARLREEGEYILVVDLVAGGPAERGGELLPGDRIVAVAQAAEEPVDCIDMRLDHVVQLIRGPKGTEVALTVLPAGAPDGAATREIRIVRDEVDIELAAAKATIREADGLKIAVLDVPSFYADPGDGRGQGQRTTDDMRRLLLDVRSQGVNAVVVDLRRNGGGALAEAVEATGLFLPGGPVVQIRDRDDDISVLSDEDAAAIWGGPLVVLTSMFSASASEIFAAAIQDHGRGLVIGSPATFGKGTVQELADLTPILARVLGPAAQGSAGALKFTSAKFYRVNGGSTQERGVVADVVIPSPFDGIDFREADLPHALPWDEVKPARGKRRALEVDRERLQAGVDARVRGDPLFLAMAELRRIREERESAPVSLSLAARRADREALDALQERLEGGAADESGAESEEPDPVLEEAIRVTLDFVRG